MTNYMLSLESIKERNGGELPSDVYLMTNNKLSEMLYDLTGKLPAPRTSKEILVKRLERATQKSTSTSTKSPAPVTAGKRKNCESANVSAAPSKKPKIKRGCIDSPTAAQVLEMKRVVKLSVEDMACRYKHRELSEIWYKMGVISQFPQRSGKETVVQKLREFAERNLDFHDMV